jgi:hypothetical protein
MNSMLCSPVQMAIFCESSALCKAMEQCLIMARWNLFCEQFGMCDLDQVFVNL